MQIILNGIIVGGIYALLAIGFNLIYSTVRFFHLAYGTVALLGAYLTWLFQNNFELNFWLATISGVVLSSLFGLLTWVLIYKPLRKRKSSDFVMMVASFGLFLVMQNAIGLIFSNNIKSLSVSDTIEPGHQFFGLFITSNQILILFVALVMLIVLNLILKKTRAGLMIRAIGENAELAKTSGVAVNRTIYLVFLLGTAMSSIGAILTSLEIGIRPTYGLAFILKAIVAAVIGGIGSISGALYGALILGIAENIGIFYFGSSWQETVAFVLLTIFLLFRPQGLVAAQKRLS